MTTDRRRIRGLETGQSVKLMIGDLPAVDARVEQISDSAAVIGLFKPPVPSLREIGEIQGIVEAIGPRGVTRLVGTMRQFNDQPDAVRLDFDQAPEVIQRRQFVRIEAHTEVWVTREDGRKTKTTSANVSGAGVLLVGPADLAMDETVKLEIDVGHDAPPVPARGRMVRETRDGHKGVRIEMIEEGDRERLIKFVFELQRRVPRVKVR